MGNTKLISSEEEKQKLDERLVALDDMVLVSWAERKKVTLQLGRILNEQKALLGYGKFQRHVEEKFSSMFYFRSAERYMEKAQEADAKAKSDKVSDFKLASDEDARELRKAAAEDKAEVESAAKQAEEMKGSKVTYRVSLRMTAGDVEAAEALRKSPEWSRAERRLVECLRKLFVRYSIVSEEGGSR